MVGKPSHIEFGAPDPARAKAFYSRLFGWAFHDTGNGAWIDTSGVRGGLHRDQPWVQVFFNVPDLDDAVRRIVELGGEVNEGSSQGPEGGTCTRAAMTRASRSACTSRATASLLRCSVWLRSVRPGCWHSPCRNRPSRIITEDRHSAKIFATLWDADRMNAMVDRTRIRAAVADNPGVCEEFWWGQRLGAVQVRLSVASSALVAQLLEDAWRQKAPRRLVNSGG